MKTQIKKETQEIYTLSQSEGNVSNFRIADITFTDGQFDSCKYRVKLSKYDYNDWMFIKEIALKIEELQKSYDEDLPH